MVKKQGSIQLRLVVFEPSLFINIIKKNKLKFHVHLQRIPKVIISKEYDQSIFSGFQRRCLIAVLKRSQKIKQF